MRTRRPPTRAASPPPIERTTAMRAGTTKERHEVGHLRDETANQRDQSAKKRDQLAAQRDRDAVIADERAHALDDSDALSDRHTLRLQELRGRALESRKRAAANRERATRDRRLAARDRELAARDREQAKKERELAGTDELTGARRRGVGVEELQREIDRARRTDQSLVVAYIDIDGLKAVNDARGHAAGDELLRDVVEGLQRHMRSYDLVVRLGGDEFLCVLPGVSLDEVQRRLTELGAELQTQPTGGSVSVRPRRAGRRGNGAGADRPRRPQPAGRAHHRLVGRARESSAHGTVAPPCSTGSRI